MKLEAPWDCLRFPLEKNIVVFTSFWYEKYLILNFYFVIIVFCGFVFFRKLLQRNIILRLYLILKGKLSIGFQACIFSFKLLMKLFEILYGCWELQELLWGYNVFTTRHWEKNNVVQNTFSLTFGNLENFVKHCDYF